jgi:hypothetical protein
MGRFLLHIGLLLLLCVLTGIGLYATRSGKPTIEAVLRCRGLFDQRGGNASVENYDRYRATYAKLIQSDIVVAAALRDEEVGQLPILSQRKNPVEWVKSKLEVEIDPDSELILVRMPVGRDDAEQIEIGRAHV